MPITLAGGLSVVFGSALLMVAATPKLWSSSRMHGADAVLRIACVLLGVVLLTIAAAPILFL